jgi:hypothetical protein
MPQSDAPLGHTTSISNKSNLDPSGLCEKKEHGSPFEQAAESRMHSVEQDHFAVPVPSNHYRLTIERQ